MGWGGLRPRPGRGGCTVGSGGGVGGRGRGGSGGGTSLCAAAICGKREEGFRVDQETGLTTHSKSSSRVPPFLHQPLL